MFITSANVLHISAKLSFPSTSFGWKYHQSCPHHSALTIHELVINNFSTYFKAKWYSRCLLPLSFLFPVVRFYKKYQQPSIVNASYNLLICWSNIKLLQLTVFYLFIFYLVIHFFQYYRVIFWNLFPGVESCFSYFRIRNKRFCIYPPLHICYTYVLFLNL
jgi:hypothetical protein